MKIDEVQDLIEQSILAGRQIQISYTNAKGVSDDYLIHAITSTWRDSFITVAESLTKGKRKPFNKFRYDRISVVDITEKKNQPSDHLIEKMRDDSLFSDVDNRLFRKGGIKGYRSSLNFISDQRQQLTKPEAEQLLDSLNIPKREGLTRGVVVEIKDGDSYDILLETSKDSFYDTRLFGVDAPETSGDITDSVLGWQAKTFVENMFKKSRCCYVMQHGIDSYKRYRVEILNADEANVGIALLEQGLGFPMMSYMESSKVRDRYEKSTRAAFENKKGLWSLEEVSAKYNNVMSDSVRTTIGLLEFIPNKRSAITRYLKQSPRAKIVYAALERKQRYESRKSTAREVFENMTRDIHPDSYDLDAFRHMCEIYVSEINQVDQLSNNAESVKDLIMHVEEMIDELRLGKGEVKGNFSKGKNKLIYHDDPENRWYKLCIPEVRFQTVKDAKYCGFRKK